MGFKQFEEIIAWQDARALLKMLRPVFVRENVRRDFDWIDQISRSAASIMANIAEGFESQSDKQFATFCSYAKRSSSEVRSHLYVGLDAGYLAQDEFEAAMNLSKKIGASLSNLMLYLRKSARKVR